MTVKIILYNRGERHIICRTGGTTVNYQELYRQKLTTAEEAVKVVKSGDWVDYAWCTSYPVALDKALAARKDELFDVKVRGGMTLWMPEICKAEDAGDHFILVFTVHNEAGALAKILNIIGSHGFNMSSLHSRPLTGMIWKHYFFAELEGNANSSEGKDLLRQLNTVCDKLKIIGTYRNVSL